MRRGIALAALLVVIAGCGMEPGKPILAPGSMTPTSSAAEPQLPTAGAPKVESPLDTGRFELAPCDSLTEEQLAGLFGATPTGEVKNAAGPTCTWRRDGVNPHVTVTFLKTTELGISNFYLGKDKGGLFRVLSPAGGYPAVAWGVTAAGVDGDWEHGRCHVAVGVTDRQVVDIVVGQSDDKIGKKDPCEDAHGIAEMVIGNIKGAQ
ncbi:DUF3558 domain-containing protein [Amycolatopsis albispora]|uniref:DUF3558 domain-containing protein n=1 Tax=Amycolatopsis albispora TaxID=1804986 RepID=A0A344LEV0_9PSEU|nr:DUF3558 domain-containing protein [Amycolatopsis albispora]AXB46574.1 hypothetical protein A4R43_32405 [Amycolatopsis albispora]